MGTSPSVIWLAELHSNAKCYIQKMHSWKNTFFNHANFFDQHNQIMSQKEVGKIFLYEYREF